MSLFINLKDQIRSTLQWLHLDITPNLRYDRLTLRIMQKVIKPDSNCIDVGCHKGEILDQILRLAPHGKHFAFEPIPIFSKSLQQKYASLVSIFPFALSNQAGTTSFHFVKNAPAFSGIKERSYLINNPNIEKIEVELKRLDDVLPVGLPIHFIKIDVEGGEFDVMKGGINTIKTYKPIIIFESGLGASDRYGTLPQDLYLFIKQEAGLHVSRLQDFLNHSNPLSLHEFVQCYEQEKEFYYVAHP